MVVSPLYECRGQGEKDVRGVCTPKLMMEIMELMDVNPLETLLYPVSCGDLTIPPPTIHSEESLIVETQLY